MINQKVSLNKEVINNFKNVKLNAFALPLLLLLGIVFFLYQHDSLSVNAYIEIQKEYFLLINAHLSQYPKLMYNLTQIGDTLVFFALLSYLLIIAPKIWEALLSSAIISAILSNIFKSFFSVPRPARVLDNNAFTIIGEKLTGMNSLPSGHSITTFTFITILILAFMPHKTLNKILWTFLLVVVGLMIASTRVGVGAHFPFDVLIGSIIGCISGIIGIFVCKNYPIWQWISNPKYYPIFMIVFLLGCIAIGARIYVQPLVVYFLALFTLIISLLKLAYVYFKK